MATIKKMASTAKKSAKKAVTMTAAVSAMCVSMGLNAQDTDAAQAAFEDMAQEFGSKCLIVDMNPFDGGLIA